jgi:hypothetical protein
MWREFAALLERSREETAQVAGERDQIVARAVRGLELLSTHELFTRLLDVDPEMLLPYMTQRPGRFQDAVAQQLAADLKAAMASGAVREDDPRRLARSIVLAMRGFAFAARDGSTRRQRQAAATDVALMLDGLLRP